jgi:tetratricopeptide (TPR) repeat protein
MSMLEERLNKAALLEREGDLASALDEYKSIIDGKVNSREAFFNIGSLYSRMNNLNEALVYYKKALAIKEDYLIHFNIGNIYYKKGEYKKAVLCLNKSRRLNEDFAHSIITMGLCFSRLKNIKAAESCFRKVLSIWPENNISLTALAIMYYETMRYDSALEYFNRLLNNNVKNEKIRMLRANVLYRLNRMTEYSSEIKSIKKNSQEFISYDRFIKSVPAVILTDRYGTIESKIQILEEKTDSPDSLISLSLCHLFKGDTDTALDYLFEAKRRN